MSRGRKPKTAPVIPMTGDGRGDGREERNNVSEAERLKPERLLNPEEEILQLASVIWDEVAPELAQARRLKKLYVRAIEQFCIISAEMNKHFLYLAEHGETYESQTRNGKQIKSRPEVGQYNEKFRQWKSLIAMLGMSPADERALMGGIQGDLFAKQAGNRFANNGVQNRGA